MVKPCKMYIMLFHFFFKSTLNFLGVETDKLGVENESSGFLVALLSSGGAEMSSVRIGDFEIRSKILQMIVQYLKIGIKKDKEKENQGK